MHTLNSEQTTGPTDATVLESHGARWLRAGCAKQLGRSGVEADKVLAYCGPHDEGERGDSGEYRYSVS